MIISHKYIKNKIVYVEMDNVLVDLTPMGGHQEDDSSFDSFDELTNQFSKLKPIKGAVQALSVLGRHYDVYILSAPLWNSPTAWSAKSEWLKTHFGGVVHERLILCHNKHLNVGDYIIDNNSTKDANTLIEQHIHFGSESFENWRAVLEHFGCDLPPALMTDVEIKSLLDKYKDIDLKKLPRNEMTPEQYKAHAIKMYRAASSHCIMPYDYDEDSNERPKIINRNRNCLPVKPKREDFTSNHDYKEMHKIYKLELSWYRYNRLKECDSEAYFNEFNSDKNAQRTLSKTID